MGAIVRRGIVIWCLAAAGSMAFGQAPRAQSGSAPPPQELGPATTPTIDKAAEAARGASSLGAVATAVPVDPKTFVLGPQDILVVRVWREPELSTAVQIRPDGMITLPLVGDLPAAGMTLEQIKTKVVESLSEFINKPEVMVSLQSLQSRRFHITGEVGRTGTFPLVVPITVLEALMGAGGFREFANTKKITILRKGKLIKFNYQEVIKGKNMQQNIFVENDDYIVVP